MDIRLSGHGAYRTEYHVVWIPKYRRLLLNPGVSRYLVELFPKGLARMPGCEIVECNIQVDHIHMVMVIPPKYAVSDVIGRMKGMTSSDLRKKINGMNPRASPGPITPQAAGNVPLEGIQLVEEGVLEREHSMVTWVFCLDSRCG